LIEWPQVPGRYVAIDTETTGGLYTDPPDCARVAVVSVAWRDGSKIVSAAYPFAFGTGRGAQATLGLDGDLNLGEGDWKAMLEWLASHRLVAHGAKFDLRMLAVGTDEFEGADLSGAVGWDTVLASRDLDPHQTADLEQVEMRMGYLDKDTRARWRETKRKVKDLNRMAWEQAAEYARLDAEITYAAFEWQMDRYAEGEGDRRALDEEIEYMKVLGRLEQRGIGYDFARSQKVADNLKVAENRIKMGLPFRATLPKAKAWFFAEGRATPSSTTATGAPQLDEREIARLADLKVPYAAEYALLRRLESARTKWFEPYAAMCGWDGRLRTDFSQAKVISGRLSSTRVNLQAIPHEYQLEDLKAQGLPTPRELFVAAPGAKLWELDLSQAELRVAAVQARCEPMLQMIRDGVDIHGQVATQLFKDEPGSDTWDRSRSIGKRADFSFIFGIGADTFQVDLANYSGIWLELRECNRIVNDWRRLYPEYSRANYRYMEAANHWGYIRLVNGRARHFDTWEQRHKSFNQYVQGSLAELMREWLVQTERAYPGLAVLTIHDSLVLETGDDRKVQDVKDLGERIGTEMFNVPMLVDLKVWGK
jgi:DNA polymerase-1